MSNIEHLLENGLEAVDKAFEDKKDCYLAFKEEMRQYHNRQMLASVNITRDELWQIIQYIKFCREMNLSEKSTSWKGGDGGMKTVDIMEMLTNAIDKTIFRDWKHEGFIDGFTSEDINFEVDGKEYVLKIHEVKDGEHWSEKGGAE